MGDFTLIYYLNTIFSRHINSVVDLDLSHSSYLLKNLGEEEEEKKIHILLLLKEKKNGSENRHEKDRGRYKMSSDILKAAK